MHIAVVNGLCKQSQVVNQGCKFFVFKIFPKIGNSYMNRLNGQCLRAVKQESRYPLIVNKTFNQKFMVLECFRAS